MGILDNLDSIDTSDTEPTEEELKDSSSKAFEEKLSQVFGPDALNKLKSELPIASSSNSTSGQQAARFQKQTGGVAGINPGTAPIMNAPAIPNIAPFANSFADAINIATGGLIDAEQVKRTYEMAGRSDEWDRWKEIWLERRDTSQAQVVANAVIQEAAVLGMPVQDYIKANPDKLKALMESSTEALRVAKQFPELAAVAHQTYNEVVQDETRMEYQKDILRALDPKDYIDEHLKVDSEIEKIVMDELKKLKGAGYLPDHWSDTVVGFLWEAVPFAGSLQYSAFWIAVAKDLDIELDSAKEYLPGTLKEKIRQRYLELSPQEKVEFAKNFARSIANHPTLSFTSFRRQFAIDAVFTDALKTEGDATDFLDLTLDNLFPLMDVGIALKLFGKAIKLSTNPARKVAGTIDKQKLASTLEDALNELDDGRALSKFGVTRTEAAATQLPKPNRVLEDMGIDDVPGLSDEAKRVERIQKDVEEALSNVKENEIPVSDKIREIDRQVQAAMEAHGGAVRPELSTISVAEDGSFVDIWVTKGRSAENGYVSLKEVLEEAMRMGVDDLSDLRILSSEFGTVRPFESGKNIPKLLEDVKARRVANLPGEFYVQVRRKYVFTPMDRGLFGANVVLGPKFLGNLWRKWFMTPSSRFAREVVGPYLRNFYGEQKLAASLESIIKPIDELSFEIKSMIRDMYEASEVFAREHGRWMTRHELYEMFPEANSDAIRGFYLLRQFYDMVYHIQNNRLYKDWLNLGYKTVRNTVTGVEWHGRPMELGELGRIPSVGRGKVRIVNAKTGRAILVTRKKLREIIENGGGIYRTETPIHSSNNKGIYHYFFRDGTHSEIVEDALTRTPLKHYPGYYPRIYEDFYYVEKVNPNAIVDGVPTEHSSITHVAPTHEDAQRFVDRMNAAEPEFVWRVKSDDPRLAEKDRIALDLDRLKIEGRLFFDERQTRPLYSVNGGPAELVDPISAAQRAARMVARQVSTEDLVKTYKVAFKKLYGNIVPDVEKLSSAEIAAEIKALMLQTSGKKSKVLSEALDLWSYIQVMEGTVNVGAIWFRKAAIQFGEYIATLIEKIPHGQRAALWVARNAHKLSPIEALKKVTFFDILATRPFRQLVLQGSQHIMLAALDPLYFGRWQLHSAALLQGAKRKAIELMGGKKALAQIEVRNARLMGLSVEDYRLLVDKFESSGLLHSIDVHSFTGDVMRAEKRLARTKAGNVGQVAKEAATLGPVRRAMQAVGFNMGEQYNLSSSYMMALRRYMKERNIKSLKQLKKEDWQAISERAGQYALAMVRPNAAAFQYGALSLPFQFLQFSHKVFLTFLRAFGKNVGNQAFTVSEARKILAGQLILFGAAGLGIKPLAESLIEKNETLRNADPIIKDIITGGILDLLIDNSLNFAIEKFTGRESDMDVAWDEFLAPGANVINILRDMIELAFEAPLTEAWLGPSEMTFSRYIQGYRLARSMVEIDGIPENVKWARAADALLAGAFAGYSDFFKARLAAKHMAWISRNGQETGVRASFEEAVAKGLLGVSSEAVLDSYRVYESQRDLEKELTKIAHRYADDASMLIKAYSESEDESLLMQLNNLKQAIQVATDENEWEFIVDKFNERMLSNRDPRTSGVEALITKLMTEGLPASEYTKAVIRRSTQLTDEEKQAAIAFIEEWERQADVASSMNLQMLESDIDTAADTLHSKDVGR